MSSEEASIRRVDNELAKSQYLEFLFEMFDKGTLTLTATQRQMLEEGGYLDKKEGISYDQSTPFDRNTTQHLGKEIQSKRRGNGKYLHCGREIESSEWKPESVIEHTKEFVLFINSMNHDGFQQKVHYEPLELYVQQAHNWLSEKDSIENYETYEEKWNFFEREFNRCKENGLYFLDKYVFLKETDMDDAASMKYTAKPVHEVMCFLYDCGYSIMIGKPRQVAATTTYMALAERDLICFKNMFIKFVTMDVDKAEDTMDDKLKYTISKLPKWFMPSMSGSSKEGLEFSRKVNGDKGRKGGANSKFVITAPTVSAINSGSPQKVFIDEAGYIKVLGKMMREARPTMFRMDTSGKLKMMRQVIIWSTAGVDEGKNKVKTKSFEEEYNFSHEKWSKGHFDYGLVPIFLDWTTRPGITKEFYLNEKRNYTTDGPDAEERMNQFKITYPSCISDMFLSSGKLLVPISFIQSNEDRINKQPYEKKPIPGFFEPIYDLNKKADEHDDVPYKIKGAKFIECEHGDPRISTWIFLHPEKGWEWRFFKGTDPIATDNGYSNMASVIWDKKFMTPAAILNYRDENHKYTFLQTMLLGLYYSVDGIEVPELLEANIGTTYSDYIEYKGFRKSLVYRTQLPEIFRGGAHLIGIDNRGNRTRGIINYLYEVCHNYGERFYFLQIFIQLRTFVCDVSDAGREQWGTQDKRKYHDDILFALVFAYICSMCFDRQPRFFKSEIEKTAMKYKLVMDSGGNMTRQWVREKTIR